MQRRRYLFISELAPPYDATEVKLESAPFISRLEMNGTHTHVHTQRGDRGDLQNGRTLTRRYPFDNSRFAKWRRGRGEGGNGI